MWIDRRREPGALLQCIETRFGVARLWHHYSASVPSHFHSNDGAIRWKRNHLQVRSSYVTLSKIILTFFSFEYCSSMWASIKEILSQDGIWGFFSGLIPKLLCDLTCVALASTTCYIVNRYYIRDTANRTYFAGLIQYVYSSCLYPLQVVSTCMIVSGTRYMSLKMISHYVRVVTTVYLTSRLGCKPASHRKCRSTTIGRNAGVIWVRLTNTSAAVPCFGATINRRRIPIVPIFRFQRYWSTKNGHSDQIRDWMLWARCNGND